MELKHFYLLVLALFLKLADAVRESLVAPYVDATRMPVNFLTDLHKETGLKAVTLAFVLGTGFGCTPSWGGESTLEDPTILNEVKAFQKLGGQVILATGGALGPYLESSCISADQLVKAYMKALNIINSTHLDIDIEASFDVNTMMGALKKLRFLIPDLTISFTLMVQGDDYGLTDSLGIEILKKAVQYGVEVNIINGMTMEFGTKLPSWGDAVIAAGESIHKQIKQIWHEKSDAELYSMLGITPMIGRNFNGKIFQIEHAKKLVEWAKERRVGYLSFWSLGRDNGNCPYGGISPDCSSISQDKFEFSKILQKYSGTHIHDVFLTTQRSTSQFTKPSRPTERPTSKPKPKIDCSIGTQYIPHETYCSKYYWCFDGNPHLEECPKNLVWDPSINSCNYINKAKRSDCI